MSYRLDGSGYHHLSGDAIHPHAKLVACADVFDALYSRRPYKEPWEMEKILRFGKTTWESHGLRQAKRHGNLMGYERTGKSV